MIESFRNEYSMLSNFEPVEIIHQEIKYPSVEHFYQAMKTKDLKTRNKIASLPYAGQAKKYGAKLDVRSDWDDIKVKIMYYGLKQKFKKEPFRSLLLDTGDQHIQEGNWWGDNWWGVDLKTNEGKNVLGKLLMKIRTKLQKQ